MDFEPISPKWNVVDTLIYKIEKVIGTIVDQWRESKDPEPDVEEIIAAETQHLTEENEEYKKMCYPAELVFKEDKLYCPRCSVEIPEAYSGKCCYDCGQRLKRKIDQNLVLFGSDHPEGDDCKNIQ